MLSSASSWTLPKASSKSSRLTSSWSATSSSRFEFYCKRPKYGPFKKKYVTLFANFSNPWELSTGWNAINLNLARGATKCLTGEGHYISKYLSYNLQKKNLRVALVRRLTVWFRHLALKFTSLYKQKKQNKIFVPGIGAITGEVQEQGDKEAVCRGQTRIDETRTTSR